VLALTNLAKEVQTFTGRVADKVLTADSVPDAKGDVDRIVLTMLHDNRFLYRLDRKRAERTSFTNVFKVGATKEGVAFAGGSGKPECIISGGLGTVPVEYMGKTYYVCCSGCASEFRADPARYVKEYEEKKSKSAIKGP
jgi:hypothetical protein